MAKTDFNHLNHVVLGALDQTQPRVQHVHEFLEQLEHAIEISNTTWGQDEVIYNLSSVLVAISAIPTDNEKSLAAARDALLAYRDITEEAFDNLPHTSFIIQTVIDNAFRMLEESAPAESIEQ